MKNDDINWSSIFSKDEELKAIDWEQLLRLSLQNIFGIFFELIAEKSQGFESDFCFKFENIEESQTKWKFY